MASNRGSSATVGPALEGLDREQQEILGQLEDKRQKYEPLRQEAERAVGRQMRVFYEIKDLERRLEAINAAIETLR